MTPSQRGSSTAASGQQLNNAKLKILQINLHHSKEATSELVSRLMVRKNANLIVLIQEPWINNDKVQGLGLFKPYYDTNSKDPRTAILATGNMNVWYVPQYSNRDMVTCTMTSKGKTTYFASVYSDINLPPVQDALTKLTTFCNNNNHSLIIGCDSNAHSSFWGSDSNNPRGDEFEEFILCHDLNILNDGRVFTFQSPVGNSKIDITLVNDSAAPNISN